MLKRLYDNYITAVGHIIIEIGDQHLKGHWRVLGGADLKRVGDRDKVHRIAGAAAIARFGKNNGILATGGAVIPVPSRTSLKTDGAVAHKAGRAAGITERAIPFQSRRTNSHRAARPASIGILAKEVKDVTKAGRPMIGITGGTALPADRSHAIVAGDTPGVTKPALRFLVGGADQSCPAAAAITRFGKNMGVQPTECAIIGVTDWTIFVTDRAGAREASLTKRIAELSILFCSCWTGQGLNLG